MQWLSPIKPYFKLNVNGATFSIHKSAGIGAIVCDHAGRVEAALSKKLYAPIGPMEIEARALDEGVNFSWEVGIRDLVVESDSQVATIIEGTRLKLLEFRHAIISHVKTQGNRPAHIFAQYVKNIDDYVSWIEENPIMIESVLV